MATKGDQTRQHILDVSLALFTKHGYDGTTMRAIAAESGISVGSSYYYFPSKDHLVQAFYARTYTDLLAACEPILERERGFRARLQGVMHARIDTVEQYHGFAGVLFRTAADPHSPLNPFSAESQPLRQEATNLFARVLFGSDTHVTKDFRDDLPKLLWTYHMGIILFWIYDVSPGCRRTHALIDESTELIAHLMRLVNLPPMKLVRSRILRLIAAASGASDTR